MNITTAKEIVAQFESKGWEIKVEQDTNDRYWVFVSNSNHTAWYDSFDTYFIAVNLDTYTKRCHTRISAHRFGKVVEVKQRALATYALYAMNYNAKVGA
jgi:hypothetical protein